MTSATLMSFLFEVDRRYDLDCRLVFNLEVRLHLEAAKTAEDVRGERAQADVVLLDRLDVAVASNRDPVLGAFELDTEIAKALIGLQIRVTLGDDHETRECASEFALSRLEALEGARVIYQFGGHLD